MRSRRNGRARMPRKTRTNPAPREPNGAGEGRPTSEDVTYRVYVVELDRALCAKSGCSARNGLPPVYVGQTYLSPVARFEQHRRGYKSSRHVRQWGIGLLPALSVGYGPYAARTQALEAEAQLASDLSDQGYCVFGGH
jgi:hypothetical protein